MLRSLRVFFLSALSINASATDWPHWRGPDFNGISRETGWSTTLDSASKPRWKANVGIGYASFAVAADRAYTVGNQNGADSLFCFDTASGEIRWKHSYAASLEPMYYAGGTSASPTVEGVFIYSIGKQGQLFCLQCDSGKVVWAKDLRKELSLKLPDWGLASSPLIFSNLLILNIGRAGLAVEKATGKIAWSSGKEGSGYATAVPFKNQNEDCVLLFAAQALVAVQATGGKELWRHPWKTSYNVNAADPIVSGTKVFISSGYNRGCAMLDVSGPKPKVVWESNVLRSHCNAPVLIDGFLYGLDGDVGDGAALKCVDFNTGTTKWSEPKVGAGALMAADGKLIVLTHRGELRIVAATPEGYKPAARAQVLAGKGWTVPVLANGQILCRNDHGDVVCLDVKEKETK